ncbi:MAG TPA: metallophosphoesterase [Myxococcota bacterium]|nr:metallophosphoesterase [Myxococcota bacterium]
MQTTRRELLTCAAAWAGAGVVWTVSSGILSSRALASSAGAAKIRRASSPGDLHFVQISDTHIGFDKEANPDPVATAREAVAKINALDVEPAFLLHTGDLTHAQKPGAFDVVSGLLQEARAGAVFTVPGEHDVFVDGGKEYLARFGTGTLGSGWRSFDHSGVHFIGLVNVVDFKSAKVGALGDEQLAWLQRDLAGRSASTPIVVFVHIPLWAVYPEWGWATTDGEQALGPLRRFGSVTVLNGHIHQVLQKVEGSVTFHTAMSTAYPQPAPGTATGPGPLAVPAEHLRSYLGLREVIWRGTSGALAVVDSRLA